MKICNYKNLDSAVAASSPLILRDGGSSSVIEQNPSDITGKESPVKRKLKNHDLNINDIATNTKTYSIIFVTMFV